VSVWRRILNCRLKKIFLSWLIASHFWGFGIAAPYARDKNAIIAPFSVADFTPRAWPNFIEFRKCPNLWEVSMANPNAIVSTVIRIEPPIDRQIEELLRSPRGLVVGLDGGRQALLNPSDPRSVGFAQILDGLSKQRLPVYLEIDPSTSAITRLLIPHVTRVVGVRQGEEGALAVDLYFSQARHFLRRDQPGFTELEKRLREAAKSAQTLIVTEDDAHNIIDVRPFARAPGGEPLPFPDLELPPGAAWPPPPALEPQKEKLIPWWPWPKGCVSSMKAQQVFNVLSATSCNPIAVPPPCIPFLYPDDGCWGRAHEMCRIMINMGLKPRKVWIQGNLFVKTKNNPNCHVSWGWHVAPTLCVHGPGFFQWRTMVIDPSLFTSPVAEAVWKGVQGDPNATLTPSDASIFYLWGGVTDPTYVKTNQVLAFYRLQLHNRSIQFGPPPYANCP
jgi:hypothetical protein